MLDEQAIDDRVRGVEIAASWRSFHWRLLAELAAYLDEPERLALNRAVADGGRREDDAIRIVDIAVRRRAAGELPRGALPAPKGEL